ncbi:MAG: thiol-disulfide isomerase/thioredoxin [Halieaceae bacterium]|jgi:thiol-disulfide isomerase/thioredoxin
MNPLARTRSSPSGQLQRGLRRVHFRVALIPALLLLAVLLSGCGETRVGTEGTRAATDEPRAAAADPIAEHLGDWLFINYWAQWCKPCIREIPELNELSSREGYAVLGVNYDGAVGEELQQQLSALSVDFPTLMQDPAARFAIARPQVLPTTLIVSPQGALVRILIGPQTAETLIAATALPAPVGTTAAQLSAPTAGAE